MASHPLKVAIIGGGPAGLVTLKYLKTAHKYFSIPPIEAHLFEAQPCIGGVFQYQVYEDAELVSSKYLTCFSDFRLPSSLPVFLTPAQYVAYLRAYCDGFGLWDCITTGAKVLSVRKKVGKGGKLEHILMIEKQVAKAVGQETSEEENTIDTLTFNAVAICTGVNHTPFAPDILGLEHVPRVLHSRDFKSRAQFRLRGGAPHSDSIEGGGDEGDSITAGKEKECANESDCGEDRKSTVVILGVGETGQDIAYMAVTTEDTKEVILCHQKGFMVVPKNVPEPIIAGSWGPSALDKPSNKPLDCAVASLFDTAYLPQSIQQSNLGWQVHDTWVRIMFKIISGTSAGLDQWVGAVDRAENHVDALFIVKSSLAIPYLSTSCRSRSLWNRIRAFLINVPIPPTNNRAIDLAPWPTHISPNGVMHFAQSSRPEAKTMLSRTVKPDILIFCTGYQATFPFLPPEDDPSYARPHTADVRGIYARCDPTAAFIGFVRPTVGAIPPLAEMQAQLWVLRLVHHLLGPSAVPKREASSIVLEQYELDFALHARGNRNLWARKRGVDGEAYTYQLALDMGSAPCFSWVCKNLGWRELWTWAMGPNFNSKFRLVGPWATNESRQVVREVMRRELWKVTSTTGGWVFFLTYTVLPLLFFGMLSLVVKIRDAITTRVRAVVGQ